MYNQIDTPALLIDQGILLDNIMAMQDKAQRFGVNLRPHTKTHKMPELAKLQLAAGACGITVAKVGEAEVMAEHGLEDIFIANQVVGLVKLCRLRELSKKIKIRVGVDNEQQVDQLEQVFADEPLPIEVLIEVEVGENRCGVVTDEQLTHLTKYIMSKDKVRLVGVFSHEGHTYSAKDVAECIELALQSQRRTVEAAQIVRELGAACDIVSIGSTPSLMHAGIIPGITEIHPGTYILMDAAQANAIGSYAGCAATVLATIISKPNESRVVVDAGAKALTAQKREAGICYTPGNGVIKSSQPQVRLSRVYDEHGLINDQGFYAQVEIGDKVEIIPNHICPVCNLYDTAYLVSRGQVLREIPILCRGKLT